MTNYAQGLRPGVIGAGLAGFVLLVLLTLSTVPAGATAVPGSLPSSVSAVVSAAACTATDLNGGFESGAECWTLSGINDGIARIETLGSCFGSNNTKGITFPGGTKALNIRSSLLAPPPPGSSLGVATSVVITFGRSVDFKALSENDDIDAIATPVNLRVRIVPTSGSPVVAAVQSNVLTTSPGTSADGCTTSVGDPRSGMVPSAHIPLTPVRWPGKQAASSSASTAISPARASSP